eukprot:scaffold2010_cov46-Cyclotella_meneghiniana.AAC.2
MRLAGYLAVADGPCGDVGHPIFHTANISIQDIDTAIFLCSHRSSNTWSVMDSCVNSGVCGGRNEEEREKGMVKNGKNSCVIFIAVRKMRFICWRTANLNVCVSPLIGTFHLGIPYPPIILTFRLVRVLTAFQLLGSGGAIRP